MVVDYLTFSTSSETGAALVLLIAKEYQKRVRVQDNTSLDILQILIAEDNPLDVQLLSEAFRELNLKAQLVIVSNGEECLNHVFAHENLRRQLPDLILLDLNLPLYDGHHVLRRLKTDERTRHIPVIILSSSQAGSDVDRAYSEYANAFVRKPETLAELVITARGLKTFWTETACLAPTLAGNNNA